MKRTMPWSDDESDDSSADESSSLHSDSEHDSENGGKKSKGKSIKQKTAPIDFDALKRYGYKGGPSVLKVPPPKEDDTKKDWSWSSGKEKRVNKEIEETYEERKKTREALSLGEQLPTVLTRNEKKNLSFSQKEKKKRDLGQASRGKNYVEEEKRLLRDNGVYSGFDT
ncbi:uncharacterized protein LOC123911460 [Trifolium pratense]|uniref:uncharacterized protein LOC123910616 n=1 Tax=Trifolium pratense TaxID=57577 RepID=UPI001E6901DD|nr:uncharacterized protein LOC123910616 [Trifolium pratense]XP_045817743.1 uncharacterized protein LOC123910616 [Trifolium pratense]XP_045817747.1 uncharacterized protein LOC123910616 [Trifolium pratense]XP_045817756.1 uncharacterized protein LOC123910616 [Trifolium pratense]XP_045818833.1 uncharacterized protein LOC123911460 [Trifolium pratense]XP_045818839.1 uncharacterized protein LOC123911460 [Trifolium pratense]XP_045818846.1 uncharacterized protein LOC123911460 [Trifolium pratense]XP_0